jgi:ribosome-binding factor A
MPRQQSTPETRSVRLLKVGEQVRHVIAELLLRQEVHDDVLSMRTVSVTEVRMSPDLRHAAVYVKPLLGSRPCGPTPPSSSGRSPVGSS